jgi:hypothetical protein
MKELVRRGPEVNTPGREGRAILRWLSPKERDALNEHDDNTHGLSKRAGRRVLACSFRLREFPGLHVQKTWQSPRTSKDALFHSQTAAATQNIGGGGALGRTNLTAQRSSDASHDEAINVGDGRLLVSVDAQRTNAPDQPRVPVSCVPAEVSSSVGKTSREENEWINPEA